MVRRIAGLPGTANDLAFSHDGERLAVLLGTGGLRLFRQKDWAEIARDETYAERGGRADFAPDGRLATTCADGKVRVYAPGLGGAVSPELTLADEVRPPTLWRGAPTIFWRWERGRRGGLKMRKA